MGVVGPQDLLPVLGVILAQPLDPPRRVVEAGHRVVVGGGHQGVALPQKAAQAAVDERRLGPRGGVVLGGFHGLVDQGEGFVRRLVRVPAQRQGRAQQGISSRGWRAGGQLAAQGIGAAQLPQHLEQQGLHPGAQTPIHRRKGRRARLAAADGLQGSRHSGQLLPQRYRARRCSARWRAGRPCRAPTGTRAWRAGGVVAARAARAVGRRRIHRGPENRLRRPRYSARAALKPKTQASRLAGNCAMAAL